MHHDSPVCEAKFVYGLGTGAFKLGVNYAPGIVAQREAAALGYAQNLWLHGPEHYLTEVRPLVVLPLHIVDYTMLYYRLAP